MIGPQVKSSLKRFYVREMSRQDLFEDLNPGEYYLPSYVNVERILDIDDKYIDPSQVDWMNATIPSLVDDEEAMDTQDELVESEEILEVASEALKEMKKKSRKSKSKTSSRKMKQNEEGEQYLHSKDCRIAVKWEGLSYSDATFENVSDLVAANVEYEGAMRAYYRREQLPAIPVKGGDGNFQRTLIPEALAKEAPSFPCGNLRDFQYVGQ